MHACGMSVVWVSYDCGMIAVWLWYDCGMTVYDCDTCLVPEGRQGTVLASKGEGDWGLVFAVQCGWSLVTLEAADVLHFDGELALAFEVDVVCHVILAGFAGHAERQGVRQDHDLELFPVDLTVPADWDHCRRHRQTHVHCRVSEEVSHVVKSEDWGIRRRCVKFGFLFAQWVITQWVISHTGQLLYFS